MVFQGEEIVLGVRGFTYGYDFYAPQASVVFHEYAERSLRRKKVHMFWENNKHAGEGVKSLRRAVSVVGLAHDIDPSTWDHSELDKYGLGTGMLSRVVVGAVRRGGRGVAYSFSSLFADEWVLRYCVCVGFGAQCEMLLSSTSSS